MILRLVLSLVLAAVVSSPLHAGGSSLFAVSTGATPLFDSNFQPLIRHDGQHLLADRAAPAAKGTHLRASGIDRALFDLIASAEAGSAGYDAVQHGARIRPVKAPTDMTLGEIFDWIDATPGQHHAIGRYQIIPSTLRRLVTDLDLTADVIFSPDLQDRLALELAIGAGYTDFLEGGIDRNAFMANLARVWAGLPLASGRSHYHGKWGNRATIGRAGFEAEMTRIFADLGW